jgi:hypothetical protein
MSTVCTARGRATQVQAESIEGLIGILTVAGSAAPVPDRLIDAELHHTSTLHSANRNLMPTTLRERMFCSSLVIIITFIVRTAQPDVRRGVATNTHATDVGSAIPPISVRPKSNRVSDKAWIIERTNRAKAPTKVLRVAAVGVVYLVILDEGFIRIAE